MVLSKVTGDELPDYLSVFILPKTFSIPKDPVHLVEINKKIATVRVTYDNSFHFYDL